MAEGVNLHKSKNLHKKVQRTRELLVVLLTSTYPPKKFSNALVTLAIILLW